MIHYNKYIKKMYKTLCLLLCCILLSLSFTACKNKKESTSQDTQPVKITKSAFMLNTIISITLYHTENEEILQKAIDLCGAYEKVFSRTLEESELYKLNRRLLPTNENGGYLVSDDLAKLIENGLYYSELSNGNFDITIAPLTDLWNFSSSQPKVPTENLIKTAIDKVDYTNVAVENNAVYFSNNETMIDLGAIAKGFIADRIKDFLIKNGVESAMINLGGNVLCVGEKSPNVPFNVGIQKPFADRNETIAILSLSDYSVVSSGIYERFFKEDGVSYHHILNPKTGYPYDNDIISVTIISKQSVDGDGLSTTCFSLGLDKGLELIHSLKDTYAIFITEDYNIHYSDGLKDAFHIEETES